MASYYITINRSDRRKGKGTLSYKGTFQATYDVWWDPSDTIPAGKYTGCSKTYMASAKNSKGKKREGIFIPKVKGYKGIFVHYWPGEGANLKVWSDGCSLVTEDNMLKMWNDITPSDAGNVIVEIIDASPATGS